MWYLCRLSSNKTWIKNRHSIPATKKVVVPLTRRKVAAGAAATVKNHLKEMGLVMRPAAAATVHAKTTVDKGAEMADTRKKNLTANQQEDLKVLIDLVKVTLVKVTNLHAHRMVLEARKVARQIVNRTTPKEEVILAETVNDHSATAPKDQIADPTDHRTSHLTENLEQTVRQVGLMVPVAIADHPAEKTLTDLMAKVRVASANLTAAPEPRAMRVARVPVDAPTKTEPNAAVRVAEQEKNSESPITKTKSVEHQRKNLMLMVRTNQCRDHAEKPQQTSTRRRRNLILKRKIAIWKMMVMSGK